MSALESERVEGVLCLGDIIGYGPDPDACLDRTSESGWTVVAGNHDHGVVGLTPVEPFNENARSAIEWTRRRMDPHWADYLTSLPLVHETENLLAVHATPNEPARWHYLFSETAIVNNLEGMTLPLCFVGHSHVPVAFVLDADHGASVEEPADLRIKAGCKYLINVGSVGQPRDGDPRAAFGILEEDRFLLRRAEYDVASVQAKMHREGLPTRLIERLSLGQ
jgi:diadenosine tetraphosphatase ApaH/serine/threonine PP2A family protein phosphatase